MLPLTNGVDGSLFFFALQNRPTDSALAGIYDSNWRSHGVGLPFVCILPEC